MKKAISSGKQTFLNVDTIIIDEKYDTISDLQNLPLDLDPAKVCTPQISDNIVAFSRGQPPLSNFYKANFHVIKTVYDCEERHYMRNKADFANRPDLIKAIMDAETPNDCYKIDKQIDILINLDEWHKNHALVGDYVKWCQDQV